MVNDALACITSATPRPRRACQACAKRRTRCDQKQPCHRCEQNKIECVRKGPERLTKSQLRQEKAQLQAKHEAAYIIFDTLASRKQSDDILELLRRDEPIHQIARRLMASHEGGIDGGSGGSKSTRHDEDLTGGTLSPISPSRATLAPSPMESTLSSPSEPEHPAPHERIDDVSDVIPIDLSHEPQLALETLFQSSCSATLPEHQIYDATTAATNLTTLDCPTVVSSPIAQAPSTDFYATDAFAFAPISSCGSDTFKLITLPPNLVLDLTDAFFTWHAAPFPAFQRSQFAGDFLRQRTDNCSPALMRIVSCLGCRALGGYDPSLSTYASLGNRLFEESKRLLVGAPMCVADVHAFGLLALHQLGIGRYEDAAELAGEGVRRMASIVASERSQGTKAAVSLKHQSALCSAVTLARFVRLMLSYLTEYDLFMTSSSIQNRSQEADDVLYLREPLQIGSSSPHPAYSLIEIVYRHVTTAQSPNFDTAHTETHHITTYHDCLLWCKIALGLDSPQSKIYPFMHMLYHFCLLILWRPFCPSPLVFGAAPAAVCTESAGAILLLAGSSGVRDHREPNQFFLAHLMVLVAGLPGVAAGAPEAHNTTNII